MLNSTGAANPRAARGQAWDTAPCPGEMGSDGPTHPVISTQRSHSLFLKRGREATFPEVSQGCNARIKFTQTLFGPNKIPCPGQAGRRWFAASALILVPGSALRKNFQIPGEQAEVCGSVVNCFTPST